MGIRRDGTGLGAPEDDEWFYPSFCELACQSVELLLCVVSCEC